MEVKIATDWKNKLHEEFSKPYFEELADFVRKEYQSKQCYPPANLIFSAFELCRWDDLKVVIIGQDPYHGPGQANGLCFSVKEGIPHPPSLVNIFKECAEDMGIDYPKSGNLEKWAKQGVLLLNATLTVEKNKPTSHQKKGWEEFTNSVIKKIASEKSNLVFMLWGGFAKEKIKYINREKHLILTSGHPSPLSANRGFWFGNKHFSKANQFLEKKHSNKIEWRL